MSKHLLLPPEDHVTLLEAALLTGLSYWALLRQIERRGIPKVKVGRLYYVKLDDLKGRIRVPWR